MKYSKLGDLSTKSVLFTVLEARSLKSKLFPSVGYQGTFVPGLTPGGFMAVFVVPCLKIHHPISFMFS